MRTKVGLVAGLVSMIFLTSGLSAQETERLSAAVVVAAIGFNVYTDQIHIPFIGAIREEVTNPDAGAVAAYYAALVSRGFLDFKNYSVSDTFLYASSATAMDFFGQLTQILGDAEGTTFSARVVVIDGSGNPTTVLTTLKLNDISRFPHDPDKSHIKSSTNSIEVSFSNAVSNMVLTYFERRMYTGVTDAEGKLIATSRDGLTTAKLEIKGFVDSVNDERLLTVVENAAQRMRYDTAGTVVDAVDSKHRGSYTIRDVAAWSYYNGIISNEQNSLVNLVAGVCRPIGN